MEAAGLFPVPVFFSEKRDILTGSVTSKEKQTATFSNYGDCISAAIAAVEWQEPQISRHLKKKFAAPSGWDGTTAKEVYHQDKIKYGPLNQKLFQAVGSQTFAFVYFENVERIQTRGWCATYVAA